MIDLRRIVVRLSAAYGADRDSEIRDPFALVLYENIAYLATDDRRRAAFNALRRSIGLTPRKIAAASDAALIAAASQGGVYPELRAARMREAARLVLDEFGGDVAKILREEPKRRRQLLKRFPAIGDPGVDKILLLSRTQPVLALDSNGLRVLTRLGVAQEKKSYAATYRAVQEAAGEFGARDFDLLITANAVLARHGREICKRTAPLCELCVINRSCAYYRTIPKGPTLRRPGQT
jgi:endonuclease III